MKFLIGFLVVAGIVAGSLFLVLSGFSDDRHTVNLVLQQEGKTYLYTTLPAEAVALQLQGDQPPVVQPFLQILEDDERLYIEPANLETLANVMGGTIQVFERAENSVDGYFARGDSTIFQINQQRESTEKIGEQRLVYRIELTNAKGQVRRISWSQIPMKIEPQALENCELRDFTVIYNPAPGETVSTSEEFLVVDLQELATFFDPKLSLSFDKESSLLYLKK